MDEGTESWGGEGLGGVGSAPLRRPTRSVELDDDNETSESGLRSSERRTTEGARASEGATGDRDRNTLTYVMNMPLLLAGNIEKLVNGYSGERYGLRWAVAPMTRLCPNVFMLWPARTGDAEIAGHRGLAYLMCHVLSALQREAGAGELLSARRSLGKARLAPCAVSALTPARPRPRLRLRLRLRLVTATVDNPSHRTPFAEAIRSS